MKIRVPDRPRPDSRKDSPAASHLVFWGTAAEAYVLPQNDWAGDFGGSEANLIYPAPQTTAFFGDTDFTVATWVRPSNTAAYYLQFPYSQWNETATAAGVERKFCFFNDTTRNCIGFAVYKLGPGQATVTTQGGLGRMLDGHWYRLVGIHRKGVEISFYVNNQFVGSIPWPHGVEAADTPLPQQPWIGAVSLGGINVDPNLYWRGQIGPTCYYTRVWTPQEVAWDYNNHSGRRYGELGQPGTAGEHLRDRLVAFWQMTEEDTRRSPYLYTKNLPNIIIRRDSHSSARHLSAGGTQPPPLSTEGILPKATPEDDDRIQQLTDRSSRGNTLVQPDHTLRPYWDSGSELISIEPGNFFDRPNFSGLDGSELSLYLVSILKDSTENEPWLYLNYSAGKDTGLKVYRQDSRLTVKAWIGGGTRELNYRLSYPAERLLEIHYNGSSLSLWENGEVKASTTASGGFDDPLNYLVLGPTQGFKELLVYNRAHQ